jgi:hypothetical protein
MDGTVTVTSFQKDEDEWIFLEKDSVLYHGVDVFFQSLTREEEDVPVEKS